MRTALGKQGEALAVQFLKQKKYEIVSTNFATHVGEIDIVAKHKNVLVFVEVKTRTSTHFGLPREAVTPYKQNKIRLTAQQFLQKMGNLNQAVRFDVIDILNNQITHIENAF